jgi:SagB-type dehydrogenase family enzyme
MSTLTKLTSSFIGRLKPDRVEQRGSATLALPEPVRDGGTALLAALTQRRSSREFAATQLPLALLSSLLWAAYGVNRPETGGRTAPSALNAQEIDVYVALPGGLYVYDARAHRLCLVKACDARRVTGYQDFVDHAPLDLIYVADHAHTGVIPEQLRRGYAAASAGAIAQNVYLFCAANGLATVVRGWFDRSALSAALDLGRDEEVVLTQTVGFPAPSPRRIAGRAGA